MKILVACEKSQAIANRLRARGHKAYSCDIQDCAGGNPQWHIKGDALKEAYNGEYDMMIAHPPCTYLTCTGARWFYHPNDKHLPTMDRRPHPKFPTRWKDKEAAIKFFMDLWNAPIEMIAIENPIGCMSTLFRRPDQIIKPFEYGDNASKKTCLWLKGLPKLVPTNIVECEYKTTSTGKRFDKWFWDTSKLKGKERQEARSVTFPGIAEAIAEQWGVLSPSNTKMSRRT